MKRNANFMPLSIWFRDLNEFNEIEFCEFNESGMLIHARCRIGEVSGEVWVEYDAKGNLIHQKNVLYNVPYEENSKGENRRKELTDVTDEKWIEYDAEGRMIHKWDSGGNDERIEYDAEGKVIHRWSSYFNDVGEEWTEYTSDGIKWHGKCGGDSKEEEFYNYNSDGFPVWHKRIYPTGYTEEEVYEYDSTGRTCTVREINGKKDDKVLKFDEAGNCIYCEDDYRCRHWMEYDEKGRQIYAKDQKFVGEDEFFEWWEKFDDKGNCIYRKDVGEYGERECWKEYDDGGNVIYQHEKASNGSEIKHEWDAKGACIRTCSKNSDGSEKTFKTEYDSNGNLILHGDTKYENTYWPDGKTLKMSRVIE